MYNNILKLFIVLSVLLSSFNALAQLGVSYHQSNLPFVGINFEINEKFLPEIRIGTDNFIEDTSLEVVVNYIFKKNQTVDVYAGIGGKLGFFEGPVLPIGLNIYPFENKKFGFQIELALIFADDTILRGSAGIRYKF